MPTTIQVDESTKQKTKVPASMFGALGRAKSMKEILRGLRDEGDRL